MTEPAWKHKLTKAERLKMERYNRNIDIIAEALTFLRAERRRLFDKAYKRVDRSPKPKTKLVPFYNGESHET